MNLTKHEQLELIRKIENMVDTLGYYLYPQKDPYANRKIDTIENALSVLKQSFYDENTYIKLIDRETGDVVMKYFEKGDVGALCYKASQYYAWSDCDDTYRVEEIVCDGEKIHYVGWQPGMLFEFRGGYNEIVYSATFPEWDH